MREDRPGLPAPAPAPDDATARQIRAALPDRSSWVAANAGSGKTKVLTSRVARLLLAGTEPQKILCLTYTTAAAAEMQGRLFRMLGDWAMRSDEALRAELLALGTDPAALDAAALGRARTLFAQALETPGGLKIQTIHAFCDALLRRFPLEAGVAPGFRVLDDRAARAMREEVLDAIALGEPRLMAELAAQISGDDPEPLLRDIGANRSAFAGPLDRAALAASLGLSPGTDLPSLHARLTGGAAGALLAEAVRLGAASGPKDQKQAEKLRLALTETDPARGLDLLEAACLTQKGTPAAFPAKGVRTAHPAFAADYDALVAAVIDARAQRLAQAAFDRALVLNRFARVWLAALDARKASRALLDFDDMIDRSRRLLADPATAAWVLWKLDGGIDHILVDEAQDTSPAQWEVVEALSDEFFVGAGARDLSRTIFVVGDEKQSIYSFQGADPEAFGGMRRHFERRLEEMGAELQRCELIHSFRSAQPVLDLVDAVFAGPAGARLDTAVRHVAFRADSPGRVELWPFRPKPEAPEEGQWWEPVDVRGPGDPVAAMAEAVAAEIRGWLDARRLLPGTGRPIRAGDVMILVQRRGPQFHAVIRALKRAGVPVAGADVLRLGGELAVKDLLAALRVAATPEDDLSLAAVLRSPLGGLTEEELFALAHGRRGRLLEALRRQPPEAWPGPRAMLEDLRDHADFLRPFELLQRVLVRHDGRRALVARLGAEAEDGVDALLQAALDYETAEPPTLIGFLDWIDRDEMKVKRRADEGTDEVRVMTVHGAKGLEAEIVILPDTGARSEGNRAPQVLRLAEGTPVWRVGTAEMPPAAAEADEARRGRLQAENMRLLYVALTRARRWLIVCGAGQVPKPDSEAWYSIVEAAMEARGATPGAGGLRVLEHLWSEEVAEAGDATAAAPASVPDPAEDAPAVPRAVAALPLPAPPVLSPSDLGGEHRLLLSGGALLDGDAESEAEARTRGEALHRLLEHLHGMPEAARAALAARLLPGRPDIGPLLAEAGRVFALAEAGAIFGPGSHAEVDLTAVLPVLGGARILGRIDRLVIGAEQVLAIDYKSNRAVPAAAEAVPEGILRQMGAYRAALARIWPGRTAATAILWTRAPRLMRLPDALVDAALARAAAEAAARAEGAPGA